ncbi:hypothetical protein RclHR1_02970002 [Rhizophagus clarus]|uniref:Protein kinase domain-containing protein n=1 Tax=Rhizophagus clarus TaxID=94130 RepID=A0A2Z6R4Q2_9GLOM|nr:hypothetical protein RclHR1_02970002 [Rhizophagus clarus]
MEEPKLSDDVFEQIKNFDHRKLTEEQILLIDKLILNEELKECYKKNGLCKECKQPKNSSNWCQCKFQQNFKNWTSGNIEVDEFIQKSQLKAKNYVKILEWIEYDRFENVEYLAKGGFGTIYKAIWKDGYILVLKCLHNSQDITAEFLREIELHIVVGDSLSVINCHGITKDPESNNFMIVMTYAQNGSLRQYLNKSFNSMSWKEKLSILQMTAYGLNNIHRERLIHRDFHCGNILSEIQGISITDLGLCRPANAKPSQDEYKKIYGVLPYIAPEVLRGKEYTQESDIYGFGIIAYEVCTGLPPYHNIAHDKILTISISIELYEKLDGLYRDLIRSSSEQEIEKQIIEADKINEKLTTTSSLYTGATLSYVTNPQAFYTSRLLDFKNLPEPKNAIDNKDDSFGEYSESIESIDFTKLNIDKSN